VLPPSRRPDAWRTQRDRYPFAVQVPLRWGDMDAQGHVNNVTVGRLFEEGRVQFWHALRGRGVRHAGVVAAVYVDYLAEVRYPGDVLVAVGIAAVGRRSVRLLQAMYQDGTCVAVAEVTDVRPADMAIPDDTDEGPSGVLQGVHVRLEAAPAT
jgi:acyl-CoA thioester hydrolase